jgi:hypothetical protein
MRDLYNWSKKIRTDLRASFELKEYVSCHYPLANEQLKKQTLSHLARNIVEVELGLTLLQEIAPDDPAISVTALLSGYRFPSSLLNNDSNWQLVQTARFYLIRRKGKQWERSLREYLKLPQPLKIYELTSEKDIPKWRGIRRDRLQHYRQTLSTPPPHKKPKVKLAEAGSWYAKVPKKGHSPIEIPIHIPKTVANIARSPQSTLLRTRTSPENLPQTVRYEELLQAAREMDEKLVKAKSKPENYLQRLENIAFQLYDENAKDFQPGTELRLERLVHIVGLLNVGKSTLLEILIYYFAKQKLRCALVVNDVASAVRLAYKFRELLDIKAAPVLGSDRAEHLKKVYEPLLSQGGEDITQGGVHPAWRWFSPICPLLALAQSEDKWDFGGEPCHSLYQKEMISKTPEASFDDEDLDDWEEREAQNKFTCPLYYKCPRHQVERDIAEALVWILTPASFIHTRTPRQIFEERYSFAEAIYKECHFLFVDEADRVQVQFDAEFAPDETLLDNSENSFLNRLGSVLSSLYRSNRVPIAADLFSAWKRASDNAQIATDLICHQLYNYSELENWLGSTPFTGRSLFARLIRDLTNPSDVEGDSPPKKQTRRQRQKAREKDLLAGLTSPEQREKQKQFLGQLEEFLQNPFNRSKDEHLTEIALTLLSSENPDSVSEEIENWWKKWMRNNHLSFPKNFKTKDFIRNTQFAILITMLENRLGFLIDHLSAIARFIDLHDLSKALVYRPPRDYLSVIPAAPIGNILGFRYTSDRTSSEGKGGKLEYFRYVGVGRYLLLNFPELFAVDNWQGPHTILISGTSYIPNSPAYHIKVRPTILLKAASGKAGDAGISKSNFFFKPQRNSQGQLIALSGLLPKAREKAANDLVKAIATPPGQGKNFLDSLLDTLKNLGKSKIKREYDYWCDRERLLLITNSYKEAELVGSSLKPFYLFERHDEISILRRDNAPPNQEGLRRSQIQNLKDFPHKIIIAPLMALERGHNILNNEWKAAFGTAVFLCRPMPVPDDWQSTVQQLNAWALDRADKPQFYREVGLQLESAKLTDFGEKFYESALGKMRRLNCRAWSFKQLEEAERSVLCSTQLVSIWQIVGRLVRGGVPCNVYFLDKTFAPQSANGERDRLETSLLVGMIKELTNLIEKEDLQPYQKMLGESLYQAFFTALKNTEDFHYDGI